VRRPAPLASALVALVALIAPATAAARDRDHDQLPDRWEQQHGLSVAQPSANGDPDRDGVDNRNEHREDTDPRSRDSDHDGRADGREDADHDGLSNAAEDNSGNDPIDPDSDDDGVRDGRELAGTIVSYADGVLRIRLATGGLVQGLVDDITAVDCETEARLEHAQRGRGRGRHPHGKRANRKGRAAQADEGDDPADDESTDDEDPVSDDESSDDASDEDISEDDGSDGVAFEDGWGDEGDGGEPTGSCAAKRLRHGARVHESERYGSSFLAVELVR
jgi:hypothetical protein